MKTKDTSKGRPIIAPTAEPAPSPAVKLFNEIKGALHGGGDSKQWLLPLQINKVECIPPPIVTG